MISYLEEPTLTHFQLRAKTRNITNVVYMPSDQHYYIFVRHCAWNRHVCRWLYFADAIVAKAKKSDSDHTIPGSTFQQ